MEPVTSAVLQAFFERLSERYRGAGELYLLGGSALCLLGNPRETLDIDYTVELPAGEPEEGLRTALAGLAADIVPSEFRAYFEEVRRRIER